MGQLIYSSLLIHKNWKVYLAATANGLCFVGTDHSSYEELEQFCNKQFPHCEIIEDKEMLIPYENELKEYFEGTREQFTFLFDINGTPFQKSVWEALCEIPFGQTKCYSDIAHAIENPKAIRAVGTAIGANPLSIIIPCHRVIGKDGTLTGYSGGLDVKEKLLNLEGIKFKVTK